ncbi:hypothetical protein PoB_005150000 [Plakobranchus ocellatus]|uniref:Uncharacterized protein n=1 Tax=Plakobranchus ocellatus TaxID=259542 RepID=A0AAV4C093_9GAST|nr:hypothetical protein PoB_005150000 [Plakobranchus ocellatus]
MDVVSSRRCQRFHADVSSLKKIQIYKVVTKETTNRWFRWEFSDVNHKLSERIGLALCPFNAQPTRVRIKRAISGKPNFCSSMTCPMDKRGIGNEQYGADRAANLLPG